MDYEITRPMLAATATSEDLSKLEYPLLCSPKLDGIRVLCHPQLGPVTRKFKAVPNTFIRAAIDRHCLKGFDGEVTLAPGQDFNSVQSAVMSRDGEPQFEYHVFDYVFDIEANYSLRNSELELFMYKTGNYIPWLHRVPQHEVHSTEGVLVLMSIFVDDGYEGIILRSGASPYKCGRSTLRQQGLIKYKEFADAEGTVVGFEELSHNENEQSEDAFGLAERSSHIDNMVPGGTLGSLVLDTEWAREEDVGYDDLLRVGTGFTASDREYIWANRKDLLGLKVTFKYQPFGMLVLPRFPVFKAFRHD